MGKHRNSSPRENTVDYEVGYKKPPRHTQFKKGRSGNKGGRPKRNLDLKATATKVFGESVSVRVDGKTQEGAKPRGSHDECPGGRAQR
jgi:hypothetical protein